MKCTLPEWSQFISLREGRCLKWRACWASMPSQISVTSLYGGGQSARERRCRSASHFRSSEDDRTHCVSMISHASGYAIAALAVFADFVKVTPGVSAGVPESRSASGHGRHPPRKILRWQRSVSQSYNNQYPQRQGRENPADALRGGPRTGRLHTRHLAVRANRSGPRRMTPRSACGDLVEQVRRPERFPGRHTCSLRFGVLPGGPVTGGRSP